MEDKQYGLWDEMLPEALGLIFRKLSLQEILTVVPRVCTSWRRTVAEPYCWEEIDIREWSINFGPPAVEWMLHDLISRSSGSLRRLRTSGVDNIQLFHYIADHARCLRTLELPMCLISDEDVEQVAPKLSNLTFLDVSGCIKMGPKALESLGKNCVSLVGLRRTMKSRDGGDWLLQVGEAKAIAAWMPKLRQLEMAHSLLDETGVMEILSCCRELEILDIRGCYMDLDEDLLRENFSRVKVVGPFDGSLACLNDDEDSPYCSPRYSMSTSSSDGMYWNGWGPYRHENTDDDEDPIPWALAGDEEDPNPWAHFDD